MPITSRQTVTRLLANADDALASDFADLAARVRDRVLASADAEGKISPQRWRTLQQEIAALILAYFVSMGQVYTIDHNGDLLPQSPFMHRLWNAVSAGTQAGVDGIAAAQRTSLTRAPDLAQAYQRATVNPFSGLAYDLLIPEAQDQYADYVPQYDFTWSDDRTMSDRVLAAAATTRAKVGALVRELLASQASARDVADTLVTYLTASLNRPNRPYGVNGRYDAERLMQTETVFAFNRSQFMSALLDPFITEVDIVLSPTHKGEDDCDSHAAGSPYPLDEAPVPPFHSYCACTMRFRSVRAVGSVINRLRDNAATMTVKGALAPDFAQLLLRGGTVHAGN